MYRRNVFGKMVSTEEPFFTIGENARDFFKDLDGINSISSPRSPESMNEPSSPTPSIQVKIKSQNRNVINKQKKTVDETNRPYYITSLGGKVPKSIQPTPELQNSVTKRHKMISMQSQIQLLKTDGIKELSSIDSANIRSNLLEFVNSITPGIMKAKRQMRADQKENLEKGQPNCNNHLLKFDTHLIRSNQSVNQVFEYPRYINLPMLKIIEDELRLELEIQDDMAMQQEFKNDK